MCGFGAMTEAPFLYVFIDEHKIVTIRAQTDLKERVERVLKAFDLEPTEEPAGADSAAHEHRSVLVTPEADENALSFDEIVGRLRDEWRLVLNVDPDTNSDDDGNDLGVTAWRCVVRIDDEDEEKIPASPRSTSPPIASAPPRTPPSRPPKSCWGTTRSCPPTTRSM